MKKIHDYICRLGLEFFDNDLLVTCYLILSCLSMAYCIVNLVREVIKL